ncbi:MAG: flavin monoamine oxidase family protein [Robiginitalea sp.]|jgi:monoamine oxidase
MISTDVLIIGGGLTGLTLHYLLRKEALKITVLEARNRAGGRIHTLRPGAGPPVEMGATWLGAKHTRLVELLKSLGIDVFPQKLGNQAIYEWISTSPHQLVVLPPNEEPSFRIQGGTETLTDALASEIGPDSLYLDEPVEKITSSPAGIQAHTNKRIFQARVVVSTLPPNLLLKKVAVTPELPGELTGIMGKTHTWMGESIKFGLTYKEPFWRDANSSGTVFSNVGPVSELYDHSAFTDDSYALKGFLNGSYASMSKGERCTLVLAQLRKYYGSRIENHTGYNELVWAREAFTYAPYTGHVLPHQHNGHEIYRKPLLEGKLFIAGSETASDFPGYMEGAVRSAEWVRDQILQGI